MSKRYEIYKAPGWHSELDDPVIATTDDARDAAMRAGCRADLRMPGGSNCYDAYTIDTTDGSEVERIESFRCDHCHELIEWAKEGPYGALEGQLLDCPEAVEKHLVTWLCEECAANLDDDD